MLKTILRFLVVALIAVSLGLLVYHLNQPAGAASAGSSINSFSQLSQDIGGEHDLHEGRFSLINGLIGITGNILLVGIVTLIVVLIRKLFTHRPEPARAH